MAEDFQAALNHVLATDGMVGLKQLGKLLRAGGKREVRRACSHCGQPNRFKIEVADVAELRRTLDYLTAYTTPKPKTFDTPVSDIGRSIQHMTDQ
jgi:hypothetical protein